MYTKFTPQRKKEYYAYLKDTWLVKEGIEEGKREGKKEGMKEIAKKLLDILDTQTIALKTGLTIEEVEKLRK